MLEDQMRNIVSKIDVQRMDIGCQTFTVTPTIDTKMVV
jgi:hypothetical protein